jgi:hypothetical protein
LAIEREMWHELYASLHDHANTDNPGGRCSLLKLAEKTLQDTIRCDLPGADKEAVTLLFYLQFAEQLRQRSREGLFAKAFLGDLVENFPDLADSPDLWKIAGELVIDITLHKPATERITGGDSGLMII